LIAYLAFCELTTIIKKYTQWKVTEKYQNAVDFTAFASCISSD